jgi:hypothetical protein
MLVRLGALGALVIVLAFPASAQAHFSYCGHGTKIFPGDVRARFLSHSTVSGVHRHIYAHEWKLNGLWLWIHNYSKSCGGTPTSVALVQSERV